MSRADKIRAVAQQAHDNGDCVCCLPDVEESSHWGFGTPEMVADVEESQHDTITITISREDAVAFVRDNRDPILSDAMGAVIWAALEATR